MPIAPLDPKELDKQFIKAAQDNQLEELKNLLIQGADIHTADDYALKIFAIRGHLEIVKLLVLPDLGSGAISQGANIYANNDYALRGSAANGHLDLVKFLVTQGANIYAGDDEALRLAAANGYLEVVKFLVTQGANIHANNDDALRLSAQNSQLEVVNFLVAKGANIHVNDDEIFKTATKNKNGSILMLLNAFLIEKKLLVAASVSMPLVAASGVMLLVPEVVSVAHTQPLPIIKIKRSKI